MRSCILKDRSDVFKHIFSLAASIAVHAAVIYVLAVHFVSVKIIDFGPRVTDVVIAPPPSGMLRLPGVGGLPGNLPAVDLDFQDSIPRRVRAPQAPAPISEEAEFYSRQPVDPRLTSGFRLDQGAPAKPGPASGADLRLPIAERGGGVTGGVTGYIPPRRGGDLRRYLYGGQAGGGGAYGTVPSGGGPGRTGLRGRPQVSSSVRFYDLSPWARTVVELIQKNWAVPPATGSKADETVEISVVVLKSGGLSAIVVVAPSDDRLFNQSARDAIEESLPFPPLPDDFPEPSLGLFFVFSRQ